MLDVARVHGGSGGRASLSCPGHVRRRRLALWVWYRGDRFQGWQSQRNGRSVQEALMAALPPWRLRRPMASGRTDRGVHARCQPVSVRLSEETAPGSLLVARRRRLGRGRCRARARRLPCPVVQHRGRSTAIGSRTRTRAGALAGPGVGDGHASATGGADRRPRPTCAGRSSERWGRATSPRSTRPRASAGRGRCRPSTGPSAGTSWRCGCVPMPSAATACACSWAARCWSVPGLVEAERWERVLDAANPLEGLRAPAGALTFGRWVTHRASTPSRRWRPRFPGSRRSCRLDQA